MSFEKVNKFLESFRDDEGVVDLDRMADAMAEQLHDIRAADPSQHTQSDRMLLDLVAHLKQKDNSEQDEGGSAIH